MMDELGREGDLKHLANSKSLLQHVHGISYYMSNAHTHTYTHTQQQPLSLRRLRRRAKTALNSVNNVPPAQQRHYHHDLLHATLPPAHHIPHIIRTTLAARPPFLPVPPTSSQYIDASICWSTHTHTCDDAART